MQEQFLKDYLNYLPLLKNIETPEFDVNLVDFKKVYSLYTTSPLIRLPNFLIFSTIFFSFWGTSVAISSLKDNNSLTTYLGFKKLLLNITYPSLSSPQNSPYFKKKVNSLLCSEYFNLKDSGFSVFQSFSKKKGFPVVFNGKYRGLTQYLKIRGKLGFYLPSYYS